MGFDKIFDLTAGVYFYFLLKYNIPGRYIDYTGNKENVVLITISDIEVL